LKAEKPSFADAKSVLGKFRTTQAESLSVQDREALDEALRRLQRLDSQCGQLIKANNIFIEQQVPQFEFDPETDMVTVRADGLEQVVRLKRANPRKPISMRPLTVGGAYKPNITASGGSAGDIGELDFEGRLEEYYHNAHRILKIVKSLPGLKNFECREITIVRNKLIEHPEGEVYSFGYGSSGPVVRPQHKSGRTWHDRGLVPNTEALLNRLVQAFEHTS
jgi:hypothetical protein